MIIEDPEKFILSQVKIKFNRTQVNTEWDLFSNIGFFAGKSMVTKGEAVIVEYCLAENCSAQTCALFGVYSSTIFIVSVFIICWLRLSIISTSLTSAFSFLRSTVSGDWRFKGHFCRS